MSKVLLTFLGITDYLLCNYYFETPKRKVEKVQFIQEALINLFCLDWSEGDQIIIFLTNAAKKKHWSNALKERFETLPVKARIIPQDIPNGKSTDEIWEIFQAIYRQLKEGDEVIFDITHAFRSLPMLAIVVLSYAKVVKNIKVRGIFYGALEALGPKKKIEQMPIKERNVPIFDLTSFIELFNWTNATNIFLKGGTADEICKLSLKALHPFLASSKGPEIQAVNLKDAITMLNGLTKKILTCRGLELIRYDFERLHLLLKKSYGNYWTPLSPLLTRISKNIETFKKNSIHNGFVAVKWCLEHNLIPQGYTLLQETVVNLILLKHFDASKLSDVKTRELITNAVNIKKGEFPEELWKIDEEYKPKVREIVESLEKEFIDIFTKLSNKRNDINHAGFTNGPSSPDKLKEILEESYTRLFSYFSEEIGLEIQDNSKPQMFLLFSHKLTPEQVADAKNSLGVQRFISLPEELQRRWNAIDPLQPSLISYLEPFFTWLKINSSPGDFVFVQGDFGATFLLVSFCLSHNLIPIYATTERQVVEQKLPDGSIKLERIFKHKLFRRYELFKV